MKPFTTFIANDWVKKRIGKGEFAANLLRLAVKQGISSAQQDSVVDMQWQCAETPSDLPYLLLPNSRASGLIRLVVPLAALPGPQPTLISLHFFCWTNDCFV